MNHLVTKVPAGAKEIPVLEMENLKESHTLHSLFHSQDKVRHAVFITHSKCDGDDFEEVHTEGKYKNGIKIFRHRSNLLIIQCAKGVKTWVSDDVADPLFDFVTLIFTVTN